jgi:hypothetical protein
MNRDMGARTYENAYKEVDVRNRPQGFSVTLRLS